MSLLARAWAHAHFVQQRLPVVPPAVPVKAGVSRHPAAVAPVLVRPISVHRPRPDDDATRQAGIREAFKAARRIR